MHHQTIPPMVVINTTGCLLIASPGQSLVIMSVTCPKGQTTNPKQIGNTATSIKISIHHLKDMCVSYLNHARLWAAKKSKEKPLPLWRFSRTNRCLSLCHILVEPPWWYLESHPKSLVTSKHSHPFNVNMVDFFGPTNIYVQLSTDKLINPQTHGPTGPRPVGCWSSICAWEDERSWSPVSVWALLLEIYANDYIINSKQTLQMDSMDVNYWWLVVDDILSFPVLHCKYFLPTVELHPSYQ